MPYFVNSYLFLINSCFLEKFNEPKSFCKSQTLQSFFYNNSICASKWNQVSNSSQCSQFKMIIFSNFEFCLSLEALAKWGILNFELLRQQPRYSCSTQLCRMNYCIGFRQL